MIFAFTGTNPLSGTTKLYFIPNTSDTEFVFDISDVRLLTIPLQEPENLTLADLDKDGRLDALLGTSQGSLQYWRNTGDNHFTLSNDQYLGLGPDPSRLYLSAAVGDCLIQRWI